MKGLRVRTPFHHLTQNSRIFTGSDNRQTLAIPLDIAVCAIKADKLWLKHAKLRKRRPELDEQFLCFRH